MLGLKLNHLSKGDTVQWCNHMTVSGLVYHQGWGLLSQFPPFRYFPNFSALSKHTLANEYHVYIRQVSPQLSCGDTCQIWMWCQECSMYFCHIKNFPYGEINVRSFSNPHPSSHKESGLPFYHKILLRGLLDGCSTATSQCEVKWSFTSSDSSRKYISNANLSLQYQCSLDRWR